MRIVWQAPKQKAEDGKEDLLTDNGGTYVKKISFDD
jgi:hypothetical protein